MGNTKDWSFTTDSTALYSNAAMLPSTGQECPFSLQGHFREYVIFSKPLRAEVKKYLFPLVICYSLLYESTSMFSEAINQLTVFSV